MKKLTIILDPAHGSNVAGKRSPDGRHLEYIWSRKILFELGSKLTCKGYNVEFTTKEDLEPGLSFRKNYANKISSVNKKLLISLHNNAAGNGSDWMKATGVEIFTSKGNTNSDKYAEIIYKQLENDFPDLRYRGLKEENFTVLMGASYSAMLIEWLFQDNENDVKMLESEEMNDKLIESLLIGIDKINDTL